MHFLIGKYLRDDKNNASATHISERWRLSHQQYSRSVPATVRALRTLMSADWGTQTDAEIMETLYEAISDFHQTGFLCQKEMNG
jgi:hypothetical protein